MTTHSYHITRLYRRSVEYRQVLQDLVAQGGGGGGNYYDFITDDGGHIYTMIVSCAADNGPRQTATLLLSSVVSLKMTTKLSMKFRHILSIHAIQFDSESSRRPCTYFFPEWVTFLPRWTIRYKTKQIRDTHSKETKLPLFNIQNTLLDKEVDCIILLFKGTKDFDTINSIKRMLIDTLKACVNALGVGGCGRMRVCVCKDDDKKMFTN